MKELIFPYSKKRGTLDVLDNVPTLNITENGEYNVKGYDKAVVNVEGGGSSDFSTAEVTFANSNASGAPYQVKGVICLEDNGITNSGFYVSDTGYIANIPLYKGKASIIVEFIDADMSVMPIITGDITLDYSSMTLTITGNGTFTAKSTDI